MVVGRIHCAHTVVLSKLNMAVGAGHAHRVHTAVLLMRDIVGQTAAYEFLHVRLVAAWSNMHCAHTVVLSKVNMEVGAGHTHRVHTAVLLLMVDIVDQTAAYEFLYVRLLAASSNMHRVHTLVFSMANIAGHTCNAAFRQNCHKIASCL